MKFGAERQLRNDAPRRHDDASKRHDDASKRHDDAFACPSIESDRRRSQRITFLCGNSVSLISVVTCRVGFLFSFFASTQLDFHSFDIREVSVHPFSFLFPSYISATGSSNFARVWKVFPPTLTHPQRPRVGRPLSSTPWFFRLSRPQP